MDVKDLQVYLDDLHSCCSPSTRVKDAIETLLRIHRKILHNKNDPKYRKLKLSNPTFVEKVWSLAPAVSFMMTCGWIQVDDSLEFHRDENLLDILNVLLNHRFVFPSSSEWKEECKIQNLNISEQKEEELRRKAALERQKALEEYKKDKLYREQLAKEIKEQIADDRREFKRRQRLN